nr:Chain A, PawL-Derived Peptide PLP-29 [Steirodiscus tagetes]
GYFPVGVD